MLPGAQGGAEARAVASADVVDAAAFAHQVVPWAQLSPAERAKMVVSILLRLCVIVGALYFFICSLSFLADGFRLVGGKGVGSHVENGLWAAPQRGSPASWWLVITPLGGATARQPGLLGRARRALGLFRALERIARAAQITEIAMLP